MKEDWETVSGAELPDDKGYHQGPIPGYREPQELGYRKLKMWGSGAGLISPVPPKTWRISRPVMPDGFHGVRLSSFRKVGEK